MDLFPFYIQSSDPCKDGEPDQVQNNYNNYQDVFASLFSDQSGNQKYEQKEQDYTGTGIQSSLLPPENQEIFYSQEEEQEKIDKIQILHIQPNAINTKWAQIESQLDTIFKKKKVVTGERFQTKNITKYFKTQTEKYLKMLESIHIFDQLQIKEVNRFISSTETFESFSILFKNSKIRLRCRQYYQSKRFLSNILACKKEMKTKIMLIKYLEKIRMTTYHSTIKGWKQLFT